MLNTWSNSPFRPFSIFLGDEKTLKLKAISLENMDPLDLTNCTEIDIALPLAVIGGFEHLKLSTGDVVISSPPVLGTFYALITSVKSALLNVGELQNIDVTFTIGSTVLTVRYANALSVFEV
jgi:hypothetical protein